MGTVSIQENGAAWLKWVYPNINIVEMAFSYDIDFGDSFNAAGVIFDIVDSNPDDEHSGTLSGYMISFNYNKSYGTLNGEAMKFREYAKLGANACLWEFTYYKGQNDHNMEKLEHIKSLNIPKTGNMSITISDDEYIIDVNSGQITEKVESKLGSANRNSIGFFTDHYPHGCGNCGHFKIDNISLQAKQAN